MVDRGNWETGLLLFIEVFPPGGGAWMLIDFAWPAVRLGLGGELRRLLAEAPEPTLYTRASLALVEGAFGLAADTFREIGEAENEAAARLHAAAALVAEGRRAEAERPLQDALAFYRAVGATRYVAEGEALLSASSAAGRRS